jgi:hypothetical protein
VGPRTGLDDVEKRKLELEQKLSWPASDDESRDFVQTNRRRRPKTSDCPRDIIGCNGRDIYKVRQISCRNNVELLEGREELQTGRKPVASSCGSVIQCPSCRI